MLLYHSTLGLRVIKKEKFAHGAHRIDVGCLRAARLCTRVRVWGVGCGFGGLGLRGLGCGVWCLGSGGWCFGVLVFWCLVSGCWVLRHGAAQVMITSRTLGSDSGVWGLRACGPSYSSPRRLRSGRTHTLWDTEPSTREEWIVY